MIVRTLVHTEHAFCQECWGGGCSWFQLVCQGSVYGNRPHLHREILLPNLVIFYNNHAHFSESASKCGRATAIFTTESSGQGGTRLRAILDTPRCQCLITKPRIKYFLNKNQSVWLGQNFCGFKHFYLAATVTLYVKLDRRHAATSAVSNLIPQTKWDQDIKRHINSKTMIVTIPKINHLSDVCELCQL